MTREGEDGEREFPRASVDKACDDLRSMKVRGGGRVARYAVQILRDHAEHVLGDDPAGYCDAVLRAGERLKSARPASVPLANGVNHVLRAGETRLESGGSVEDVRDSTVDAADDFLIYSLGAVRIIGETGARRIKNGDVIITHSNSQAAIGIIKKAHDTGKGVRVYCDETRPNFQGHGAAAELAAYGIDTTVVCDSACRTFMAHADRVVVGCDAIAVNGALASKIGVSQVATLAHEARVNFIVGAETYKVDLGTLEGKALEVEERDPSEIASKAWMEHNPGVKFANYVFDFTPPEYIDFYVTEKGVVPPAGVWALARELRDYGGAWSTS